MIPAVEGQPVVGSDDKKELMLGVVARECLQGVPRVGGTWQMELVVAGDETWLCSKCLTDERQPTVIVK